MLVNILIALAVIGVLGAIGYYFYKRRYKGKLGDILDDILKKDDRRSGSGSGRRRRDDDDDDNGDEREREDD